MLITSPCVVSLTWTLADAQGATLDELTDPVEFFYGGDDLLAKLEDAHPEQDAACLYCHSTNPQEAQRGPLRGLLWAPARAMAQDKQNSQAGPARALAWKRCLDTCEANRRPREAGPEVLKALVLALA